MSFTDETLLEKRKGQEYFNEVDVSNEVTLLDEFKPYNDDNVMVEATDEHFYIEGYVVTDVEGRLTGQNHRGRYFFADGNKIYCYGYFPQEESTYVKIHGDTIDDFVLLEVVSPDDDHDTLDSEHVEGVLNIDYENYKVYYEPCDLEMEDNFKGANKVPENITLIASHGGRLYLSGNEEDDDNVFISDVANPFYYPTSLPIQLPPNSDKIVGMHVYDNSIVIGRRHDIHVITGSTNNPELGADIFQLRMLNTHTGFANNNAVDIAHNYLFFLGSDGNAYALSNAQNVERVLSSQIISKQLDLKKKPIDVEQEDIDNACSAFVNDLWYIGIADKMLVYSYRNQAWTMHNNMDARVMYVYDYDLVWGTSDGRLVHFAEDEYLDFGKPYECHWHSKSYDMGKASTYKQFREFYIVAHVFDDYDSDVDVLFEVDYADVDDRVQISNTMSKWGKAKWGDRFINRNIIQSLPFIIGQRGRNIKIILSNSYFPHGEVNTHYDLQHYIERNDGVLVWVIDEEKYYLYMDREWHKMEDEDLNQRMKIYQINGDFEYRGKR